MLHGKDVISVLWFVSKVHCKETSGQVLSCDEQASPVGKTGQVEPRKEDEVLLDLALPISCTCVCVQFVHSHTEVRVGHSTRVIHPIAWGTAPSIDQADVVEHGLNIKVLNVDVVHVATVVGVLTADFAGRPSVAAAECLGVGVDSVGQKWDHVGCDGNQESLHQQEGTCKNGQ